MEERAGTELHELLAPEPCGALALIGAWAEIDDEAIDEFVDAILRSRAEDLGRSVVLEPEAPLSP